MVAYTDKQLRDLMAFGEIRPENEANADPVAPKKAGTRASKMVESEWPAKAIDVFGSAMMAAVFVGVSAKTLSNARKSGVCSKNTEDAIKRAIKKRKKRSGK